MCLRLGTSQYYIVDCSYKLFKLLTLNLQKKYIFQFDIVKLCQHFTWNRKCF